ncbi:glutamine--fructose-6-phosphate transaminase (isomerizing) [Halobacterium zhouii]|uniref:glutamine--fructose-6-phosphate transaminase (isomerizing) n=1 Tax=Halobacterium zhouii TaxID=2902624 RepID=UPI001E58B64D|nr:glutamine--fructose-6-phosphate transaminase (isomerizing) [Halobacterium zhouii]
MCGITARVGDDDAVDTLLTGLANLEYRGYDSAGLAMENGDGLEVYKREGDLSSLRDAIDAERAEGHIGIGHTRWSTHGAPTNENAHPHTDCTNQVAVVHNGIIENHATLREELTARGHTFTSETDTEVVPHVMEEFLEEGASVESAFRDTISMLSGSFAVAVLVEETGELYATRKGSPLVLGVGENEYFLASDAPAFLEFTDQVVYLEDGDVVRASAEDHHITDANGDPVDRPVQSIDWSPEDAEKGGYDHYMKKEIHEQPTALAQTVRGRVEDGHTGATFEAFSRGEFSDVKQVQFLACGTSYHAALYAQQLLAQRGVPAQVFRAGEYATNPAPLGDDTLVVGVTQSGETADTLGSLRHASDAGARTLAVTNVVGSTAARECDDAVFIRAGPEIGVAATKTFSSQVATLGLLAEQIARDREEANHEEYTSGQSAFLEGVSTLSENVQWLLEGNDVENLVDRYRDADAYFFIGRGVMHPVAKEGALKFKEITYEHAEGFAAGELKHGPLALVTPDTPVFALFSGENDEKTLNNVKEVQARGAPVIGVTATDASEVVDTVDDVLEIPPTHPALAGVAANVQLQLISYHMADRLNRAIDKPRNLAKSVTVE